MPRRPRPPRPPAAFPPAVVIDTREQAPYAFDRIACDAHQGDGYLAIRTEVRGLKSGDYSLAGYEHRVAVERKSLADCFSTIGQGRDRFEAELARLHGMQFAAVVVEAEWSEILASPPRHSQLDPKTVFRSVLAWQQRFTRVHWWFVPGRAAGETGDVPGVGAVLEGADGGGEGGAGGPVGEHAVGYRG